jgi:hypothetical protein
LLKLTKTNDKFWDECEQEDYENMKRIFSSLNKEDIVSGFEEIRKTV